jgi:hypothetical protein
MRAQGCRLKEVGIFRFGTSYARRRTIKVECCRRSWKAFSAYHAQHRPVRDLTTVTLVKEPATQYALLADHNVVNEMTQRLKMP